MTNCRCLPVALIFSSLFVFDKTTGQPAAGGESPVKNSITYFQNEIGEDAHLYAGKEYHKYDKIIKGYPYFVGAQMENNDLFYDGTLYTNIPLLFDIVRQEIVINRYHKDERITLLPEKVKYFTVAGHKFENIALSEGKDEYTGSGIYDVVFDGKASVLVKRVKRIKNPIKPEDPPQFVEEDEFYIRNGSSLYAVDSKNSLLLALNDKKELIKTYLKKNKFKFKKNLEKELITTADYYSTLNK